MAACAWCASSATPISPPRCPDTLRPKPPSSDGVACFSVQPTSDERKDFDDMKRNVLIIGAGGVAHVAAHKCAQHNDVLGDIHIASRKIAKCEAIIASVHDKGSLKDPAGRL